MRGCFISNPISIKVSMRIVCFVSYADKFLNMSNYRIALYIQLTFFFTKLKKKCKLKLNEYSNAYAQ